MKSLPICLFCLSTFGVAPFRCLNLSQTGIPDRRRGVRVSAPSGFTYTLYVHTCPSHRRPPSVWFSLRLSKSPSAASSGKLPPSPSSLSLKELVICLVIIYVWIAQICPALVDTIHLKSPTITRPITKISRSKVAIGADFCFGNDERSRRLKTTSATSSFFFVLTLVQLGTLVDHYNLPQGITDLIHPLTPSICHSHVNPPPLTLFLTLSFTKANR